MPKELPKIADSEWRVMKVCWKQSPKSAKEIIETLKEEIDWTPKTIKTLLNRLVKKGALGYEKNGRSYLYSPLINEKKCKREETRTFINRVFDGALKPMLAAFLEDGKLTPEELDELRAILKKEKGE
jgi:BlaI family transcriptional regulator, penicillinase repressor